MELIFKWVFALLFIALAGWLIHRRSPEELTVGPRSAKFIATCVVATVFYSVKGVIEFFMQQSLPYIVEFALSLGFGVGFILYFFDAWKHRNEEAKSIILSIPQLMLPVLLLAVACILLLL